MEKIGLFDLIDKFNSVASGKKTFDKTPTQNPTKQDNSTHPNFFAPQILPPNHYLMNTKLLDFYNKHDSFAKNVKH